MSDQLFARVESLFDVKAFEDLSVMIAGCGSCSAQVAQQLAMSGIKHFSLVDKGKLEVDNVIRHVCGFRYLGWRKTAALADVLRDRNPQVEVREFNEDLLSWEGLEQEVEQMSVVVVGTSNSPTRYLLNQVCVETATPFTLATSFTQGIGGEVYSYKLGSSGCLVFTRGIGGEVYSYKPGSSGCFICLERFLEQGRCRDHVSEIDLISDEERQMISSLSVDAGFIAAFHTRFTLDALGDVAEFRPKFMTPIDENYLVWENKRSVHSSSKNFKKQLLKVHSQNECPVCGGKNEGSRTRFKRRGKWPDIENKGGN